MRLLGVDPGGTNGLAWFNLEYQLEGFTQVKLDDLPDWLEEHTPKPDLIIIENYRLWKHRAIQQAGSSLPAAQAIGMVKSYATRNKIKIEEQSPQILQNAQKMSQMKMPGDHTNSHWVSAYLHGYWWLVKHNYRQVDMEDLS